MRLIRAADLTAVPWKNGAGLTREVLAHPPGAGFDGFDWRLSMADITEDGPFSVLPGIDRILILIEGEGLMLEGTSERPLAAKDRVDFPGESAVSGRLTAGPVRDLNLMVRRGRVRAEVVQTRAPTHLPLPWPESLVLVREGRIELSGQGLHRQDCAHFPPGHAPEIAIGGEGDLVIIGLTPLSSAATAR